MKAFNRLSFFILTVLPCLHAGPVDVVVFVHGTLKPADISVSTMARIMSNKIANSVYSQTNTYIRKDPYFHQSQAMQALGLHPIDMVTEKQSTAQCMAHMFEIQYKTFTTRSTRLYYTFGWSGLLNIEERAKEGERFYQQLTEELAKIRATGAEPRLHILGYSHGGNVALNLAAARQKDTLPASEQLHVETLVLLGMPVQKATDYLVSDPLFKKVYHLYSTEDAIQTLDIFSPNQFFSERIFKERRAFKLPDNLVQIRIRVTRKVRGLHNVAPEEQNNHGFLAHKKVKRIHKDPQHTELWCFRWGAPWYRDLFPLCPLPAVVFIPSLLHAVVRNMPDQHMITVDYVPMHQGAVLTPVIKDQTTTAPILTESLTKQLYNLAQKYQPKDFSLEMQQIKIEEYLKKAQFDVRAKRGERNVRSSRLLTKVILKGRKKVAANSVPDSKKILHT